MKVEPKQYLVIELPQKQGFPSDDNRILKIQLILVIAAVVGMLGSMMTLGAFSSTAPLVGMFPFFCVLMFFTLQEKKAHRAAAAQQAKEDGK